MAIRHAARLLYSLALLVSLSATAQQAPQAQSASEPADSPAVREKLDQVTAALAAMQRQLDASQNQVNQLQQQLQELKGQMEAASGQGTAARDAEALKQSVQQLQSDGEVLQAEVKQHEQTKVETASKYPLRVSGLILFSSFLNTGAVDNIDLPIVAMPRTQTNNGSLAATLRQTVIGLEGTGPVVWGAHSAADVHVDFFGGVPYAGYSTSAGTLRLRTAHVRLDWPKHALVAAFDSPLIAPVKPTSYIGLGEPPLAWSGNLWIWSPQLQSLNQRVVGPGKLQYDVALIDPAAPSSSAPSGGRQPNAPELSRQPGYESRMGYSLPWRDRVLSVGVAGYYSRQSYANQQHVDAWAGAADWRLPLTQWFELSGALYRGRALGGLGGGAFKDYVEAADSYAVRGLDTEGGWAQAKLHITPSIEANLMIGEDAGFASELYGTANAASADEYSNLGRNRTILANLTYHPKAYFYISMEYRNIDSWPTLGHVNTAKSVGLATGYSF